MILEQVRFGVIGAGGFGAKMIPQIQAAEGCEVRSVMVRDLDRARRIADEHNIPWHYNDVGKLLDTPHIDAVYVCTPDNTHTEIVIAALEAGKHVLCEKPLAHTVEECERMIAVSERANKLLMPGFMMRFHPHHQRVRQIIASGELGQIIRVRVQCSFMYAPNGSWRQQEDPRSVQGGCLWDLGSHAIDLLRYLLAREVNEVQGIVGKTYHSYDGSDLAMFLLHLQGVWASVDVSFAIDTAEQRLEIEGTNGSIYGVNVIGQDEPPRSTLYRGGKPILEIMEDGPRYQRMFEHFAQCIRKNKQPMVTSNDGLRCTKILHAIEVASEYRNF